MALPVTTYVGIATVSAASSQTGNGLGYTTIMSTMTSSWTGGADGVD